MCAAKAQLFNGDLTLILVLADRLTDLPGPGSGLPSAAPTGHANDISIKFTILMRLSRHLSISSIHRKAGPDPNNEAELRPQRKGLPLWDCIVF